jgi:hypothetical protein
MQSHSSAVFDFRKKMSILSSQLRIKWGGDAERNLLGPFRKAVDPTGRAPSLSSAQASGGL